MMIKEGFPTGLPVIKPLGVLLGLNGKELLFYQLIAIASGSAHAHGSRASEVTTALENFFSLMVFDDIDLDVLVDAMYIKTQEALLSEKGNNRDFLRTISVFRSHGVSNLAALIEAYRDGGSTELYATYVEIFEHFSPEDADRTKDQDNKIFEHLTAAFDKYASAGTTHELINNRLGRSYVEDLTTDEFLEWVEARTVRPGLTEEGFFGLTISTLASGLLESIGSNERDAASILTEFFTQLRTSSDKEMSIKGLFYRTQDALMAFRRDDFRLIQMEPPFNDNGQAALLKFFSVWQREGASTFEREYARFISRGGLGNDQPEPIRILGGDGKEPQTPIKFSMCDIERRVRAENWLINYRFGPANNFWHETMHRTVSHPDTSKMLSVWDLELKDGSAKTVYFDTNR